MKEFIALACYSLVKTKNKSVNGYFQFQHHVPLKDKVLGRTSPPPPKKKNEPEPEQVKVEVDNGEKENQAEEKPAESEPVQEPEVCWDENQGISSEGGNQSKTNMI